MGNLKLNEFKKKVKHMRFGICERLDNLEMVEHAGADYLECPVVGLNEFTDEQLMDFSKRLKKSKIKCEVFSVLFPGATIPLIGEDADIHKIKLYLNQTFQRVAIFEPKIIVFGSGGARKCPQSFSAIKAHEQLIEVCYCMAQIAELYDITIAIEPLNKMETNMVNTLAQAIEIVEEVDSPNFKMMADFYHMLTENEPASEILKCKTMLVHTHIATKLERKCPQALDKDTFTSFFKALNQIGYNNRLSIEAKMDNLDHQLLAAFDLFRSYD